jgi:hypothetical protein
VHGWTSAVMIGRVAHEVVDLLRRSASGVPAERVAAITGLGTVAGRLPPETDLRAATVAALHGALGDAEPRVRLRAIRGLRRLPNTVEAIAGAVTDDDYATREAAVRALVDRDRAAPILRAAATDQRAGVRCAALIGLRALPVVDTAILDALATALADHQPSVQGAAMASLRALARRGPQLTATVTEIALAGLASESPQRREISIELLRQLQVPGHRQRCEAALADPDPSVRQRAERGLRLPGQDPVGESR